MFNFYVFLERNTQLTVTSLLNKHFDGRYIYEKDQFEEAVSEDISILFYDGTNIDDFNHLLELKRSNHLKSEFCLLTWGQKTYEELCYENLDQFLFVDHLDDVINEIELKTIIRTISNFNVSRFKRSKTKQKNEAKRKAKLEKQLFKVLIDNTPDLVSFKDNDGRFIIVNKAEADALGSTPEEIIGKTSYDFHKYDIAKEIHQTEQELFRTGLTIENKTEHYIHPSGQIRWVDSTKIPMKDSDGNVVGLIGISRDITHQYRAERQLREETKLLQALMDNIPEAIYYKNRNLVYTNANYAEVKMCGLNEVSDIRGKTDNDLFPIDVAEKIQAEDRQVIRTGLPIINKLDKNYTYEGNELWLSVSKVPIKDEQSDEIVGVLGVLRDVTSEEIGKQQLEHAKFKAEEANKAKTLFLANMSHEIRTPMNGVIGVADILQRTDLTTDQKELANVIVKSANNLLDIIDDILDHSKIESGKLNLENLPISIRSVVEDVADVLHVKASDKGLELVTFIDPEIPEYVVGDSVRLRQILTNLVNNAIKFTDTGQITIKATYSGSKNGKEHISFNVIDTGIGISDSDQQKLFHSFSQVDASTSRKYGGTGLGLSISKHLVEMMGGSIGVKSIENKGSDFSFNIEVTPSATKERSFDISKVEFSHLNILLIIKNEAIASSITDYLKVWKSGSTWVNNIESATQTLEDYAAEFDLVIVDSEIEGTTGMELGKQLKYNSKFECPKLLLMAPILQLNEKNEEFRSIFECCITKPLKLIEFHRFLSKCFRTEQHKKSNRTIPKIVALEKMKVLVVEDNPINRKVAELTLRKEVQHIDIAEDGKQGVEMWNKGDYDLILMDIQMPEMNGFDATIEIRKQEMIQERSKKVIIVAMSANGITEDVRYADEIGMDSYLVKPFKIRDLQNALGLMVEI